MTSCPLVRGVPVPAEKNIRYLESAPAAEVTTKNIAAAQESPSTTVQLVIQISLEQSSKKGLEYILSHVQGSIWPRTISTKAIHGRQAIVNSREEALAYFKAANYLI